ncbi:hypothetical protein [Mycobacterium intracellulare]|uniref:hypothetical protein n=1 Tax=Mycobacterium intracellulare TaxID=1767 RepID=UPI001155C3A9|nr:hypothetical protein [Mycobacterium intracellulare]
MTTHDDERDIDHLRIEMARRFDAYPTDSWSPNLLAALIAVFDLEFGVPDSDSPKGPGLRVVR